MERALEELIEARVAEYLAKYGVHNHQAWSHGEVVSVASDKRSASVKINADTTPTNVPVAKELAATIAAGDRVLILNIQRYSIIAHIKP